MPFEGVWHEECIRAGNLMRTPNLYNMVVQSEDRSRTALETVIYLLLILSAVVSISSAAIQPVTVLPKLTANNCVTGYRA